MDTYGVRETDEDGETAWCRECTKLVRVCRPAAKLEPIPVEQEFQCFGCWLIVPASSAKPRA